MRAARMAGVLSLLLVCCAASAQEGAAQPGSPQFKPTPDRPTGFRGDWTGRFPGATPPLEWSRRVKGITSEVMVAAKKPAGEPDSTSHALEYFTIKDWLVCGPFDSGEAAADFEKDFLGGEADAQPNDGDKAGACAWKYHRACEETQPRRTCNFGGEEFRVDFLYLYGKVSPGTGYPKLDEAPKNNVAYAHTYLYSPREADAALLITYDAQAIKVWMNGKPLELPGQRGFSMACRLNKGWNRLLVKVGCAESRTVRSGSEGWVSKWRFAGYLTPTLIRRGKLDAPAGYETKNIAWMTKLTGQSMSQPIVLGDKLFLGSGTTDFLCVSKADGKIVWMKTITHWDLMPEAERGAVKERIGPALAELERLNAEVVKKTNEGVAPGGMTAAQYEQMTALLAEKAKAERKVHGEFGAIDPKKYAPLDLNEVSSSIATATTDGGRMYWCCGGTKAFAVLCLEPDGTVVWSYRGLPAISSTNSVKTRINEHGTHASPVFLDGKIVYLGQSDLIALDAKTGAPLWRVDGNSCGNSPVPGRIGQEAVVFARGGHSLYRASDGKTICTYPLRRVDHDSTPIIEGNTIFFSEPCTLASLPAGGANGEIVWKLDDAAIFDAASDPPTFIASPLYVNGLFYSLSNPGQLVVADGSARKLVYTKWLDGYNRYHRTLYGACASPALGGRHIFLTDDSGCTTVIEPGSEYKPVARNVIESVSDSSGTGSRGPCNQEAFYTAPTFDGGSIYLRGSDYLYCIRGK